MGHNPSHLSAQSPDHRQPGPSTTEDSTITSAEATAAAATITKTSEARRGDGATATAAGSGQSSRRRAPSLIGESGTTSSRFSVSFDTADTYPTCDSYEPQQLVRATDMPSVSHLSEEGERSRHPLSARKCDSVPSPDKPRNTSSSWAAKRAISTTSEGAVLSTGAESSIEMNNNSSNRCACGQGEECTCFRQSRSLHNLHHDAATTTLVRRRDNSRGGESKNPTSLSVPSSGRCTSSTPSRSPSHRHNRPSAITLPSQHIISFCMKNENAKGDIAARVFTRMAHKRDDFGQFCANLSGEEWDTFLGEFRNYLKEVVKNLQNPEQVKEASMNFGRRQVQRRAFGFKADFFSTLADAMTTECVFLDAAAHSTTETIEAWGELAGIMFGHIRDGYYEQVRYMRKNASVSCNSSMGQSSDDHSSASTQISTLSIPSSHQKGRFPRQHSVGEDRRSVTPTSARGT